MEVSLNGGAFVDILDVSVMTSGVNIIVLGPFISILIVNLGMLKTHQTLDNSYVYSCNLKAECDFLLLLMLKSNFA